MIATLVIIVITAVAGIVLCSIAASQRYAPRAQAVSLTTPLLAAWVVASAVWGPYFFTARIPGLFDITVERVLFACLLAILVLGACTGRLSFRSSMTIEVLMFFFVCVCVVSMVRHGFTPQLPEFPSPWNIFITGYFFPFLVFIFVKQYLVSDRDIFWIVTVLFALGSYIAVTAFFEFFDLRQFVFPRYINDPTVWLHYERARGPFLNGAYNGTAMLIGCACGVHLLHHTSGIRRVCIGLLLLCFVPAVFFTQTRAVYVGFFILAALLTARYATGYPKWKLYAMPAAVALVLLLAFSPRLASEDRRAGGVMQAIEVEQRLGLMKRSTLMFFDRPFFGVGLAQFIPASLKEYQGKVAFFASNEALAQHNHLLGMLVELGLAGTMLYLAIIVVIFRRLVHLLRILPAAGFAGKNLAVVMIGMWIVYLVGNFFAEPSYNLFINAVPFAIAGIADRLCLRHAAATIPSYSPAWRQVVCTGTITR